MKQKYDSLIYIGRQQFSHIGHLNTIIEAFKQTDVLVCIIGSTFQARDIKNPFTFKERKDMIKSGLSGFFENNPSKEIIFRGVEDSPYSHSSWIADVQLAVADAHRSIDLDPKGNHKLIGFNKDESSFYLKVFPQWSDVVYVKPTLDSTGNIINATDIRNEFYETGVINPDLVPSGVTNWIEQFFNENSEIFNNLVEEYNFIKKYKKSWESSPYEPTFVTVDSVVICMGHVLVVERGAAPGKGLYALPGGFVNPNEQLQDAMVRELYEETRLQLPKKVITGGIRMVDVFDAPNRSLRGRTITHAYKVVLSEVTLPKVKGGKSDDAANQYWMPLSEVHENRHLFFEDHYFILKSFNILPSNK